ncbi:MAG: DUF1853 family protein [Legionellales bacterium]|nr:DUF1853 family protein [Legionellales bacterium]
METLLSQLAQFNHKIVRDLVWLLISPNLLDDTRHSVILPQRWGETIFYENKVWLQQLDRDPGLLINFLNQYPTQRLGLYFENLLHFLLQQLSCFTLINQHWQYHYQGKTLGELDFLWFDHRDRQYYHVETAVKYYLHHGKTGQLRYFIGPAKKDTLQKKLSHLLKQQLPFIRFYPEAEIFHSKILLKGYLFYHQNRFPKRSLLINPQHSQATWYRFQQDSMPWETLSSSCWCVLNRLEWLTPFYLTDETPYFSADIIAEQVKQWLQDYQEPVLLCEILSSRLHFIVPKQW